MPHWARYVAVAATALAAGYLIFSPAKVPTATQFELSEPTVSTNTLEQQTAKPPTRNDAPERLEQIAAVIALMLVEESRRSYYATGRPCACPDDVMRNGRKCGANSAYSKPGGAQPYCYVSDVPISAIQKNKDRLLVH